MAERLLLTGGSGFIGSHLMDAIADRDCEVMNLDLNPPSNAEHARHWSRCDVKDVSALSECVRSFAPTRVIHLAAKANLDGTSVADFPDNTIGTSNIVKCVNSCASVELFVATSTQYVVRPGVVAPNDTYLAPYTAYGESKAVAERIVREGCRQNWVIIRPTNVWGPRHPFFPSELWRYLERRWYVHPGFASINKYYAYVTNAAAQILDIATSEPPSRVAGSTWYITDGPTDNAQWMNGFSLGLAGRRVRRLPLVAWRMMAAIGDVLRAAGFAFPVSSERLFRLTVNEKLPEDMIWKPACTEADVTLQDGIDRSIAWYRSRTDIAQGK
jgi:GlcNAc-P-P-Und epimerase